MGFCARVINATCRDHDEQRTSGATGEGASLMPWGPDSGVNYICDSSLLRAAQSLIAAAQTESSCRPPSPPQLGCLGHFDGGVTVSGTELAGDVGNGCGVGCRSRGVTPQMVRWRAFVTGLFSAGPSSTSDPG